MYDANFYDIINDGSRKSADVVVPLVLSIARFERVIDIGCGEGVWTRRFQDAGCDVIGVDGDYVNRARLCIPPDRFVPHDLNTPLPDLGDDFDLAVSLEVAEHLQPSRASSFVQELCHLAPIVLFSAAIPGQGGVGHINEQWPGYWVEMFRDNGFVVSGALRWSIWSNPDVENWYAQNLLLAMDESLAKAYPHLFDGPHAQPLPVVHPVLHDHLRGLR